MPNYSFGNVGKIIDDVKKHIKVYLKDLTNEELIDLINTSDSLNTIYIKITEELHYDFTKFRKDMILEFIRLEAISKLKDEKELEKIIFSDLSFDCKEVAIKGIKNQRRIFKILRSLNSEEISYKSIAISVSNLKDEKLLEKLVIDKELNYHVREIAILGIYNKKILRGIINSKDDTDDYIEDYLKKVAIARLEEFEK